MKNRKVAYSLAGTVLVLAAATLLYFVKGKSTQVAMNGTERTSAPSGHPTQSVSSSTQTPQSPANIDLQYDAASPPASFLGSLPSGGTDESAGRDRTYIISYQVAFFRKAASEKIAEESLTYKELQERDTETPSPPYVYYGENVTGRYDPAHPEAIAVRATIDNNEAKGYIDAGKMWLEPPLEPAVSKRYMALKNRTPVYVVPDPSSPAVLNLLQGEVVETVGQLNLQGQSWIKARFNAKDRPRYGFLAGSDVRALIFSSVDQSTLAVEEIPQQIRDAKLVLSGSDRQSLARHGFYIEPAPPLPDLSVDDMADSYRQSGPQFFITTDLYLHSFHLIFDRMLQDIEEKKFFPAVNKMAGNLARGAENELKTVPASAPQVREALLEDLTYFSVAARLFNAEFVVAEAVKPEVEVLVSAIQSGGDKLPSLTNFVGSEDFTQYKVRGHYQRNETLQRYFRGMMWFGRHNFLLLDKKQTLAAILVPSLVDAAREKPAFDAMDALITHLIGRQDKYTLAGYRAVNRKIFGTESPNYLRLAAHLDENIDSFRRAAASDLPAPQIVSVQTGPNLTQEKRLQDSEGFKFLGQRYVLDAFILNQLTSPSVGNNDSPRNLPTALDVMMVLGSKPATEIQEQLQKEQKWPNYEAQIAKVKGVTNEQLGKRATFYEQWLYAVKTLFLSTASKQLFASGEPWQYKNLNAGLASWTELKHDTILYAEQSYAEDGGGDQFEIPPYAAPGPKGYVEPNPVFFKQLEQSVDHLLLELRTSHLATEEYLDKFTLFKELSHRAEAIAQKEIMGQAIPAEDYEWISNVQFAFDGTLLLPRNMDAISDLSYLQMALIADVATDAVNGLVLEEGIGTPQRIIVVVKDASGGTRLTEGYVYSWFEFDSKKRWSDAEWKKIIYGKEEMAKAADGIKPPAWYAKFLKTASGTP